MHEATDLFRSVMTYRHEGGGVMIEIHQPCGLEEYEPGKVRTVTKVICAMSMGPDAIDEIADDMKICARRAREYVSPDADDTQ